MPTDRQELVEILRRDARVQMCYEDDEKPELKSDPRWEAADALEQAETELSSLREAADKALDWLITHPNARGLSEAKTILATLLDPSPQEDAG